MSFFDEKAEYAKDKKVKDENGSKEVRASFMGCSELDKFAKKMIKYREQNGETSSESTETKKESS